MPSECPICMCRLENNLGSLPCGHVMHFACLQTAFASKRECPICRAAYPQHSAKIQRLFFDCSRAAAAFDSSHDSSFTSDSAELDEANRRIQGMQAEIMILEAANVAEKDAANGLVSQLGQLRQKHDVVCAQLASSMERLRNLDQQNQQTMRSNTQLVLDAQLLRDREKRLRAQLSAFSYTKEEEKQAMSNKDAPKEELLALLTSLKRQNTELTLQVQKLEQDVMMQEERSGSAAQLLSNIDRGARFEADLHSAVGFHDPRFRKRARIQSAVAAYVQDAAARAPHAREGDDAADDSFSALRLAKQ
jgi:chromosome segregation ATPase